MEPLFTGNIRHRSINLSGATNKTHDLDVKGQRQAREALRQRNLAALTLQKNIRSHIVRQRVKSEWANQLDLSPYSKQDLVQQTALLICATTTSSADLARFAAWARYVLSEKALFQCYVDDAPQCERWTMLMKSVASRLLQLAARYAETPQIALFYEVIKQLCEPNRYPSDFTSIAYDMVQYLTTQKHMLSLLRQHILSISPEHKSNPSLTNAISLALLPFKTTSFLQILRDFISEVLSIPLLLNRLPIIAVQNLAASLPYFDILEEFNSTTMLEYLLVSESSASHLLANLTFLVEPRIKTLTKATQLTGWLSFLSACLGLIPTAVFSRASKGKGKATLANDMDVDKKDSHSTLHQKTVNQLGKISSAKELDSILAVSARFSSSPKIRPALGRYLSTLLTVMPGKIREDVLTHLLYHRQGGGGLLREIWRGWLRSGEIYRNLAGNSGKEGWKSVVPLLSAPTHSTSQLSEWPLLVFFIQLYTRMLFTLGDDEFYASTPANSRNPIMLDDIKIVTALLRNIGFALYWTEVDIDQLKVPGVSRLTGEELRTLVRTLLVAIHERDSRRPFLTEEFWTMTDAFDVQSFVETALMEDQRLEEEVEKEQVVNRLEESDSDPEGESLHQPKRIALSNLSRRQIAFLSPRLGLLNNIPFVIPFTTRVSVFRKFIQIDKEKESNTDSAGFFGFGDRGHIASIRRNHIADDGFIHLHNLGGYGLKKRLRIEFVDEHGITETGIDGGGLFKEFLTALGKEAFDPNRGLWRNNSNQEVYPAAHAYAREATSLAWYTFLGQIVGKALYEGILVSVPFAGFFFSKWLGKSSFIDDLASLDPELYNGLLYLKNYKGDVKDLSLTFSVDEDDMGVTRTVDLIPNGRETPVTNENRYRYIALMSHFRLNSQIREQSAAFVAGLHDLINPRWLRLFSQAELKLLVGGAETPIDIEDLRRNCTYAGIEESSDTVRYFWDVIRDFNGEQRRDFVKFVTAADKAPLLGFRELQPLFGIRDGGEDVARLPTSSTCINLLKLPRYHSKELLRQKLLTSISAHSGFDLS